VQAQRINKTLGIDNMDGVRCPYCESAENGSAPVIGQIEYSVNQTEGARGEYETSVERRSDEIARGFPLCREFEQPLEKFWKPTSMPAPFIDEMRATGLDIEVLFELVFKGLLLDVGELPPAELPLSILLQGKPICPKCGRSNHVINRDIYHTKNGEIRNYYSCTSCRKRVPTNPTGRRHSPQVVAVTLSRFFSNESSRSIEAGMREE
jgi:hypothetical protein